MNPMVMAMLDEFSVEPNPGPPVGGRAALGTAAGLGLATFVAAAWARMKRETWKVNQIGSHQIRLRLAGGYLLASMVGAGVAARPGTRRAAVVGTALGVVLSQAPLLWDPFLVKRYPVLANIWQYGTPVGGALLGVNAVT